MAIEFAKPRMVSKLSPLHVASSPTRSLMDISLPVLNGFTATAPIRERYEFRKIPMVAVSAHNEADLRASAEASGFTASVTKPIDFDWVDELIKGLLD